MKSHKILIFILVQSILLSISDKFCVNSMVFNQQAMDKLTLGTTEIYHHSVEYTNHSTMLDGNDTIKRLDSSNIELIDENSYYHCNINNIYRMKGGYLINVIIQINDSLFLNSDIVSFRKKQLNPSSCRIREGNSYKMKIARYYTLPLQQSLEYKRIYDIVIHDAMVSVLSISSLSYIFVSQNLNGLCYSDSTQLISNMKCLEKNKEPVQYFLTSVVNAIYFCEDSIFINDFFDTTQFILASRQYSKPISYWVDPTGPLMKYPPRNIRKEKHFLRLQPHYYCEKQCLSFNCAINSIRNKYPRGKLENNNAECKILSVSFLQFSEISLTVRVNWELPDSALKYSAIFILKPDNSTYKVIGFSWGIIPI
jgi:hypothetical protein